MRSTANIAGHPIHPMLVTLPIGLLVGALICDLVYWGTGNSFWAAAAFWALVGGIVGALAAALFGFIDFLGDRNIRNIGDAWHHMIGNLLAVVLACVSVYVRYRHGVEAGVFPWGITTSAFVVVILGYTGWKGGELTFRHHIGVIDVPPRN